MPFISSGIWSFIALVIALATDSATGSVTCFHVAKVLSYQRLRVQASVMWPFDSNTVALLSHRSDRFEASRMALLRASETAGSLLA